MASLQERSVLITGASSGIGAFLARELVRRGARVGLLARREERLRELATELQRDGGRASWAVADVTDAEQLHRGLDSVAEELDGADIVVANAGTMRPEPPHKFRPGMAEALYDVNLLGMLRIIDWALPRFLEAETGHLVGIASVASYIGFPGSASYCGSKAAMRVHLQALRCTLRRRKIAVTTICPGFVESELTEGVRFKMPFLWPAERAARKIADAIEQRRGEVVFPWQMRLIFGLALRVLPVSVLEAFLSRGGKR